MTDVSIVIVCMNNLKNLYPCLNSIREYTTVSYETLVVAYLFSKENFEKVERDFPWVTFIESNEIRGFSENNNLALRRAKGKYCFVLNDDTEMKMPVIDELYKEFQQRPNHIAVISPTILNSKGEISVCGRPPITLTKFILRIFHLWKENQHTKNANKSGIFKTYNILGAAFMIRTDIFREMKWFNEYFFFCPEDIELSTRLNQKGYECYVDANTQIYHYQGMSNKSLSLTQTATRPSATLGEIAFFSKGNKAINILLRFLIIISFSLKFLYHKIRSLFHKKPNADYILAIGDKNCIYACLTRKTPKEIFVFYYKRIIQQKYK